MGRMVSTNISLHKDEVRLSNGGIAMNHTKPLVSAAHVFACDTVGDHPGAERVTDHHSCTYIPGSLGPVIGTHTIQPIHTHTTFSMASKATMPVHQALSPPTRPEWRSQLRHTTTPGHRVPGSPPSSRLSSRMSYRSSWPSRPSRLPAPSRRRARSAATRLRILTCRVGRGHPWTGEAS